MKIFLAQQNYHIGNFESNTQKIIDAVNEAKKQGDRMIEDAREAIQTEKNAALADVKNQVAMLSVQIAEKLLRKNLADEKEQKALVEDFVKDLNLN